MSTRALEEAQRAEAHHLTVYHFESLKAAEARQNLALAEKREADARRAHADAVAKREALERPGALE